MLIFYSILEHLYDGFPSRKGFPGIQSTQERTLIESIQCTTPYIDTFCLEIQLFLDYKIILVWIILFSCHFSYDIFFFPLTFFIPCPTLILWFDFIIFHSRKLLWSLVRAYLPYFIIYNISFFRDDEFLKLTHSIKIRIEIRTRRKFHYRGPRLGQFIKTSKRPLDGYLHHTNSFRYFQICGMDHTVWFLSVHEKSFQFLHNFARKCVFLW